MNDLIKNVLLWVVIAIILMAVFNNLGGQRQPSNTIPYSEFLSSVQSSNVKNVQFDGVEITGMRGSERFTTYSPETDNSSLIGELNRSGVDFQRTPPENPSFLLNIFISWFPFFFLIGLWIFFMRQMQGGSGGRGAMSFGKSKARLLNEDQVKVTFADVAGAEEAKEETGELVEFLREPGKFQKLGGKIPRGILMVGPPGTGKTLLARAIAGEAKVPFFTISGSDFVEMFVGVGASRVRDMFEQAKKHSPCIIFIDEIDAVGRHRGAGLGGGHDEREQTLNQLLVEMDGFDGNDGVIVIAATNRPDVLDPALLRPGRFDRQVVVPLPDVRGREQILRVHMKKVPLADGVRADLLARGTPGCSGADLANLINEAALFAARENCKHVDMTHLEQAKDKVIMGAERKSMVMSEKEKRNTAYHEAGHCIVGYKLPEYAPVYKVTIIPRGRALGMALFLPEGDKHSRSKLECESWISVAYGGRIAEGLIFGEENITNGAASDIQQATNMARDMVTQWGYSDKLGPLAYSEPEGEVFLGRSSGATQQKLNSDETINDIDEAIRAIIDNNYERSTTILKENIDILHKMADALMKYETIDRGQIDRLMRREEVGEPADWGGDNATGGGTMSGGTSSNESESAEDTDEDDDTLDDGAPSLH